MQLRRLLHAGEGYGDLLANGLAAQRFAVDGIEMELGENLFGDPTAWHVAVLIGRDKFHDLGAALVPPSLRVLYGLSVLKSQQVRLDGAGARGHGRRGSGSDIEYRDRPARHGEFRGGPVEYNRGVSLAHVGAMLQRVAGAQAIRRNDGEFGFARSEPSQINGDVVSLV